MPTEIRLKPIASELVRPPRPAGPMPVAYSIALAIVLAAATLYGLVVDSAYRVAPGIRADFPSVMRGQDVVTLLCVPLLVWAAVAARRGSFRAHLAWLGIVLYVAYSYVLYAISPFNDAFLLYVAAIGLATYGFVVGLFRIDMAAVESAFRRVPRRPIATFLFVVAGIFGGLWLAMILPAIPGDLPGGRLVYDIASGVHTLDLALILPLIAIGGLLLWRARPGGGVLAAVLLIKMLTLGAALLAMDAVNGGGIDPQSGLWVVVIVATAIFVAVGIGTLDRVPPRWFRATVWGEQAAAVGRSAAPRRAPRRGTPPSVPGRT